MPFVEALVPEVDLAGGRLVVADVPGLLTDLDEPDEPDPAHVTPLLRADVVTIFPDYLAPLRLSLIGRAIDTGLVELGVHDLRSWTHDRHRTVDDTPYGGGAGMVMKPEPWGAALDAIVPPEAAATTRLVVPTPVRVAASPRPSPPSWPRRRTSSSPAAATRASTPGSWPTPPLGMRVDEVSIGDYVLNGGEAAVLVILEAVVRLLPGVVGNPESLTEESHARRARRAARGPRLHEADVVAGPRRAPRSCCRGTTARSPAGAVSRRWNAPAASARTWPRPWSRAGIGGAPW